MMIEQITDVPGDQSKLPLLFYPMELPLILLDVCFLYKHIVQEHNAQLSKLFDPN